MRLLKIWDSEYPWDVRAEKVMRSLSDRGHEVHLVARNRTGAPVIEVLPEGTVHRLRPWRVLGRRLDAASQFPAFMNPRWFAHIYSTGRQVGADCILVRDLPLAPTAVWAGGALGVPVVLDMAENYPAMMRDIFTSGRQKRTDWLVRNPSLVSRVESWVVRNVDHVIVVVKESGERLARIGVDPRKITVVCNTPWPSRIPAELPQQEAESGCLKLVYLGLLERPRGLEAVLQGLAILRSEGRHANLDIIGGGRDADFFMGMVRSLGLTTAEVRFHGVLPYEDALEIVQRADVGVVPHLPVESWNTTIPNKLFDYMSVALPVLTSDAAPAKRIVEEERCGVVFTGGEPADFARALRLLSDRESRAVMGARGRRAVLERFTWAIDGKRMVDAIEGVADTTGSW